MTIELEELQRGDFSRIRDWIDPAVFRIFKAPVDDRQLERLLSREEKGAPTDIGMRAIDPDTGELVGIIHTVINRENDYAHIQQLVVEPSLRGRGYGSDILTAFLNIGFDAYGWRRVQLFVDEDNLPAIACYERVGFHLDGLMRDVIKTDRGYVGMCVYSILRDEWHSGDE
jgi:RimJ/RimL family protein N-acetyltransferase